MAVINIKPKDVVISLALLIRLKQVTKLKPIPKARKEREPDEIK